MIKQAFLIPVYNHGSTLESVVSKLVQYNLPIIIVDDGNDDENKRLINQTVEKHSGITLITNRRNLGKGRSVCIAVKKAHELGFTHLFQIDADGQHDTETCKIFLEKSQAQPEALICGYPIFDSSVPERRKNGRKISTNCAEFVTCSTGIKDVMCGYRVYPVEAFYKICRHSYIDSHMGFDTEIMVRMIWANIPIVYEGVHVSYPEGGKSNFRMFRDNVHISLMFTRMTVGMLFRFPVLIYRTIKRKMDGQS